MTDFFTRSLWEKVVSHLKACGLRHAID